MADLKVELYGHPVGHLTKIRGESFDFCTDVTTFEDFQLGSTILSEYPPETNSLAIAIGNLDLHAKNISENDKRRALAVNGKYFHAGISIVDIVAEAISWGIKKIQKTHK